MSNYHTKDNKKNIHMIGKLITLIQLILSAVLLILMWNSGMFPAKYIIMLTLLLLLLFAVCFGLQYVRSRVNIVGIILSIILGVVLAVGSFYFAKTVQMLADVGGASYKTDNMVIVVKSSNPAENLLDTKNYRFGTQTAVDQENTQLMVDDVESAVGRELKLIEYTTIQEEAQALLDGKIEAAIYNEAFTGIIEDSIEDYSSQVRILYQYGIDTPIEEEEDEVKDVMQPFNVYISGIDVSGPITTNSRSDVNIIMTVNPNTKKILLTTTPRDYYVQIPNVSGEQKDKLTHAGIYGVDVSMDTLESIYGIDIAYYARVNFTSLIEIVDALGGVDVYSEYNFTSTHGKVPFVKGVNHVDGEAALSFARERYSFEDGDNQRGKNQEALLTAILQKAMSPAILKNAGQIIASVSGSVQTNMTQDEMTQLINMQLDNPASWSIESVAATGSGDQQACYSSGAQILYVMQPDMNSIEQIKQKMAEIISAQAE